MKDLHFFIFEEKLENLKTSLNKASQYFYLFDSAEWNEVIEEAKIEEDYEITKDIQYSPVLESKITKIPLD